MKKTLILTIILIIIKAKSNVKNNNKSINNNLCTEKNIRNNKSLNRIKSGLVKIFLLLIKERKETLIKKILLFIITQKLKNKKITII